MNPETRQAPAHSALADCYEQVALVFLGGLYSDVFAQKNDKTVAQTLEHRRYAALKPEVARRYSQHLGLPLGAFLLSLKQSGDAFYTRFLNPYGDLTYCHFRIADPSYLAAKGVYAYLLGEEVVYIGRCRDSMGRRIDQGYGKIHPKNCYRDGQSTNCHLNARIAGAAAEVTLWMRPLLADTEIEQEEQRLIRLLKPPWNTQGVARPWLG